MGTEYVAVAFTILFTIATSALLGRYMFHIFTGKPTVRTRNSDPSNGWCFA